MNPASETMLRDAKILAINQVTSVLFRSVIEGLAHAGADVTLLTGSLESPRQRRPFRVLPAVSLQRDSVPRRIWTWMHFALRALTAMAARPRHLAFLVTNPPLTPWLGPLMRRLFGVRYAVLVYDIYPDLMERMGMIRPGGLISRLLHHLTRECYRHAECVITLGECMGRTVEAAMPRGCQTPVHIIPNWADTDLFRPLPRQENPFIAEHGLAEKLVVMYSGAFGASHGVEKIVEAAEMVIDLVDVHFVLIGGGTCEKEIHRLVQKKALPNLLLLPWQPIEKTPRSLAAADCQIVSLQTEFAGLSVPSKTYSALAVGAAVLAVSPPETAVTQTVRRHKCGLVIPPGRSDGLAEAVRAIHGDPALLQQMKRNSRRAAESSFCRAVCVPQYVAAISRCFPGGG